MESSFSPLTGYFACLTVAAVDELSNNPQEGNGSFVRSLAPPDPRIQRIESMLRQNLNRKLSLGDLAVAVGLSTSRVGHLFSVQVGAAPTRYVKQLRLRKAAALLENTMLSVKEIAGCVGLSDVSRFIKDFRFTYGMTPSRYRLRLVQQSGRGQAADGRGASVGWQLTAALGHQALDMTRTTGS
jgi:transcriptional regulator GlxA family with amidase domain